MSNPEAKDSIVATISSELLILSDCISQNILSANTEDSTIYFNPSVLKDLPRVGEKFLIDNVEKYPLGFIGKVESLTEGDSIKLVYANIPLDEIFNDADFSTILIDNFGNYNLDTDNIEEQAKVITSSNNCRKISVPDGEKILIEHDNIRVSGAAHIRISNMNLRLIKNSDGIQKFSIKFDTDCSFDLNFLVKNIKKEGNFEPQIYNYTKPIKTKIGNIPFNFNFDFSVSVPIDYSIEGEVDFDWNIVFGKEFEISYTRSEGWKNTLSDLNDKNLPKFNYFSMNGECNIAPQCTVGLSFFTSNLGISVQTGFKYTIDSNMVMEKDLSWNEDSEIKQKLLNYLTLTPTFKINSTDKLATMKANWEIELWSDRKYLFPNIRNLIATRDPLNQKKYITYYTRGTYFLSLLGINQMLNVYKESKLIGSYNPELTYSSPDRFEYKTDLSDLVSECDYMVQPIITIGNQQYFGKQHKIRFNSITLCNNYVLQLLSSNPYLPSFVVYLDVEYSDSGDIIALNVHNGDGKKWHDNFYVFESSFTENGNYFDSDDRHIDYGTGRYSTFEDIHTHEEVEGSKCIFFWYNRQIDHYLKSDPNRGTVWIYTAKFRFDPYTGSEVTYCSQWASKNNYDPIKTTYPMTMKLIPIEY
ncbi:MAG: hypothetical protein K2H47_02555 [Muribaculaceae bacterium]|nr:hypothetical protein [Muribaculaceae bacterium]